MQTLGKLSVLVYLRCRYPYVSEISVGQYIDQNPLYLPRCNFQCDAASDKGKLSLLFFHLRRITAHTNR